MEIIKDTVPVSIEGEEMVLGIKLQNKKTERKESSPGRCFYCCGNRTKYGTARNLVKLDESGYIVAGEDCVTSTPGIFAAGDIRTKQLRQVITAAADGANAVTWQKEYCNIFTGRKEHIMAEEKQIPYKIYLEEQEMPEAWYNVRADMKNKPAPLLNPETLEPMTAEELGVVFCDELVKQELDNENPYIKIPEEIRSFYKMYRPSPLVRAYCLEEKLQTPAKIYYKFEGNNTSGSHKLNSAIAQAYYAKNRD